MLSFTQLCANEDLPPMLKNWQAWRGWKAPGEKGGEEVEGRYDRRHGLPYLPPRGLTSASVGRHFFFWLVNKLYICSSDGGGLDT